jgi:hypothetical protein
LSAVDEEDTDEVEEKDTKECRCTLTVTLEGEGFKGALYV